MCIRRTLLVLAILAQMIAVPSARAGGLLDRLKSLGKPKLRGAEAGNFLFITDHPFDQSEQYAEELTELGQQLNTDLGVAEITDPVRIYIFRSRRQYSAYVRKHIPYLTRFDTHRRAMFLRRNGKSYVFAVQSKGLCESLRHEYVHVVLNSAIPNLPIWLDEGLATYYEKVDEKDSRPLKQPGWRAEMGSRLRKELNRGWSPDVRRLERLNQMPQMGPLEYAEAWAWVHFLKHGPPQVDGLLNQYLSDLAAGKTAETLADRLESRPGNANESWQKHLAMP